MIDMITFMTYFKGNCKIYCHILCIAILFMGNIAKHFHHC